MSNQRYMMRGVSASKEDVHNAIKNIDKGIFPQAFCKIIPDILGGDPEYCNIMHADGAGTKHVFMTGEATKVFEGEMETDEEL